MLDTTLSHGDIQMYYGGTMFRFPDGTVGRFLEIREDGFLWETEGHNVKRGGDDKLEGLDFSYPLLGYFEIGDTVLFVSARQGRSYKKGLNSDNINIIFPQEREYERLNRPTPNGGTVDPFKLYERTFTELSEVNSKLETKDAVAIHRNYAVVKKATHPEPLIYHRREPIGYWDGEKPCAFEEESDLYIRKLNMELGV